MNVDKSTLNQRGYHVDWRRDVIPTYINVESTLSVYWVLAFLCLYLITVVPMIFLIFFNGVSPKKFISKSFEVIFENS